MPTRRHVLQVLAAAPALASAGCAATRDPAAAWRAPGLGERDPRRFALAHAILAPNPHFGAPPLDLVVAISAHARVGVPPMPHLVARRAVPVDHAEQVVEHGRTLPRVGANDNQKFNFSANWPCLGELPCPPTVPNAALVGA